LAEGVFLQNSLCANSSILANVMLSPNLGVLCFDIMHRRLFSVQVSPVWMNNRLSSALDHSILVLEYGAAAVSVSATLRLPANQEVMNLQYHDSRQQLLAVVQDTAFLTISISHIDPSIPIGGSTELMDVTGQLAGRAVLRGVSCLDQAGSGVLYFLSMDVSLLSTAALMLEIVSLVEFTSSLMSIALPPSLTAVTAMHFSEPTRKLVFAHPTGAWTYDLSGQSITQLHSLSETFAFLSLRNEYTFAQLRLYSGVAMWEAEDHKASPSFVVNQPDVLPLYLPNSMQGNNSSASLLLLDPEADAVHVIAVAPPTASGRLSLLYLPHLSSNECSLTLYLSVEVCSRSQATASSLFLRRLLTAIFATCLHGLLRCMLLY
jgi:hypothetical protein